MLRQQLKSKIHRASVTDANVEYEGSISIPTDLMRMADLWPNEKVLVASISKGGRLETYVQPGEEGSGRITINGGAALTIGKGERITIMAFGMCDEPVIPQVILCNEENEVIDRRPAP